MVKAEFIRKYGQRQVSFKGYYKYTFTFGDDELTVGVGGASEDIYRLSVDTNPITVAALSPDCGKCGDDVFEDRW